MDIKSKLIGTTLLIGNLDIDTIYGKFTIYTYQDIIDKKYILALCYGNIFNKDDLYMRIHSSCLMSETLNSVNCDCVDKLEKAMEYIEDKGYGILFYLVQNGKETSYINNSRCYQLIQYMQNKIDISKAYGTFGLSDDYRDYRNIKDICTMLDIIDKQIHLITNNSDKINKILALHLDIVNIISLDFKSHKFNKTYKYSEKHIKHLSFLQKVIILDNIQQPSVEPFEPYHLPSAERFIHCSTFYLPIKPIENRYILSPTLYDKYKNIIVDVEPLANGDYLAQINELEDEVSPYWMKTYVYYDISSHSEYIVLSYGDLSKIPIIRIHCELIFNRFPLKDQLYRNRYKTALLSIIRNNGGLIIIPNHNGDTASIGKYVLNNMYNAQESLKKDLQPR